LRGWIWRLGRRTRNSIDVKTFLTCRKDRRHTWRRRENGRHDVNVESARNWLKKFVQLCVIFPVKPWSKGVGSGLEEGRLDCVERLGNELEVLVVCVWCAVAALIDCVWAIEVWTEDEDDDGDEVDSSLLLLSDSRPRRCSASFSVARVQAFGFGMGGGGRGSTSSLPEFRGETSALSIICSAI
jgi:hypothetical protein